MYGLPKVHKPGEPLRPILSMCGSVQYDASKWLWKILKPVREYYGKRCVKDSFTFSVKIRAKKLPLNGYMCSFDVVSLFTNVPLEEVINICADALYRNDDIEPVITTLTENSFKELMRLVTSGVEFSFNGAMFRQIDGVAMGSPLGPTLGNIFVGFFEKKIPADEWPLMYDRYVDDVFSFFVSKAKSAEFFERLNSLHPPLRFTVEGEENGSLPFLDVRATKTASGIVTSIFRKPTFTGLYTPWDSFSPTVYKINLVRSLAHRIIRICSPTTVEGELTALRDILAKSGYPGELLDRFVTTDKPTRREGPRPCPLTLRVPWLGSKTKKLVGRANDAVRLAYPAGEVRAVYRTNKAFNLQKDRIPTQSQSNLIYQFGCRQCGSRWVIRLKGSLIAFRSTCQSTFSTLSLTHSGNGPVDRRRSGIILQKGTNRLWRVTLQQTPIAAGLTVNLTLLSCLVVGQNSIVMSLKLCTFVVVSQCYVGRNHLL